MPWELEVCLFVENQDLGPRAVVAPSAGSAYVLSFLPPFLESKKCVTREKQGRQPFKYHGVVGVAELALSLPIVTCL